MEDRPVLFNVTIEGLQAIVDGRPVPLTPVRTVT